MTGMFSTGEQFTASTSLGAVVAYTPSDLAMLAAAVAYGGAAAPVAGQVSSQSILLAIAGASVPVAAQDAMLSALTVLSGARVSISVIPWEMVITPYAIAAGGMAGFFTDVTAMAYPATAEFSTAGMDGWTSVVRTSHRMDMMGPASVTAGALIAISVSVDEMTLNQHGPVARPRAVQGQIIMS